MLRTLTADAATESVNRGAAKKATSDVSRKARPVDWPPPPIFENDMDEFASILQRRQALDGPDGIRASRVRARWNEDEAEGRSAQAVNATLERVERAQQAGGVAVWHPEPQVPQPAFKEKIPPGVEDSWFQMADVPDGVMRARSLENGGDVPPQDSFDAFTDVPVAEIFHKVGNNSLKRSTATEASVSELPKRSLERRASFEEHERSQRRLVGVILALLAFGMSGAFVLTSEQRKHAQANLVYADWQHRWDEASLRTTENLQKRMFAQTVAARAALVDRYLDDLEKVLVGYRNEASRFLTLPDAYLPHRARTPAGRKGFYLEADYTSRALRPSDVYTMPPYQAPVSRSEGVVAFAPSASAGRARLVAARYATRLALLSTPFSLVHTSRNDVLWSRVGVRNGVLFRYPGSSAEPAPSDLELMQNNWYRDARVARNEAPRWLEPHFDSMSQSLLLPCVCALRINGEAAGALGIEVSLQPVREMLTALTDSLGAGAIAILARPDGRVIADTRSSWEDTLNESAAPKTLDEAGAEFGAYYNALLRGQANPQSALGVRTERQQRLLTHGKLAETGWLLIVAVDRSALLATR